MIKSYSFIGKMILLLFFPFMVQTGNSQSKNIPSTVDYVNLDQYAGLWYEIARIPNRFQKQCARGVTAEYSIREDGRITVLNSCYKENGKLDQAEGLARVEDKESNSKLKVSFFSILGWRPFWGAYWIIDLAEDYSYATVGSPDRKYGWILAREKELPEKLLEKILNRIQEQGFDPNVFELTEQ